MKKLYRSNRNRIVGGVCGGIGEYLGIDAKYVRITFVALTVITSIFRPLSMVVPGIYIIMMLAIPVKKINRDNFDSAFDPFSYFEKTDDVKEEKGRKTLTNVTEKDIKDDRKD